MIIILNKNLERKYILKNVIESERYEQLNGENTLSFETLLGQKESLYITDDAILELNKDYFDISYLRKTSSDNDQSLIEVNAEHVSYRLNDPALDVEEFTETGSPTVIFNKILSGTGFTSAGVEITNNVTYSAQEKKSRRQLLMEFATACKADLVFDKFTVKLVAKRGNREPKLFTTGKNVSIVSRVLDKSEKDDMGNPKIAYTCTSVLLKNNYVGVGDDILLVQRELGIKENLRVLSYRYNPYNTYNTEFEIGNFISKLEDKVYEIETGTVAKENLYNGCKIGPDEGFVAEARNKNDPTRYVFARTIMNATDGISIFSSTGVNKGLERNFYVDLTGKIHAKSLEISGESTFQGLVTASEIESSTISASEFIGGSIKIGPRDSGYYNYNFEVDSLGNLFAKSGYFEGDINASAITGSSITSSTINVDDDVGIGNWLYIGGGTSNYNYKGITIDHGSKEAKISVSGSGLLEIESWGEVILFAFEDLKLQGWNVILQGANNYVDSAVPHNEIATMYEIDEIWDWLLK